MEITEIYIKNMVCPRCVKVVKDELEHLGIEVLKIDLGHATISSSSAIPLHLMNDALQKQGFQLLQEEDKIIVEKIKIFLLKYLEKLEKENDHELLSIFLSKNLGRNYGWLSNIFSEQEGMTIEKRFILLKIERVKELLDYNEMNLSQIANLLRYSSVNYLSTQFKKVEGTSVSDYKKSSKSRKFWNEL